jgi:hypothetical protein
MDKEDVYVPTADIDIHGHVRGTGQDVFGREDNHQIKYKTLTWPLVAVLMITEIVSYQYLYTPPILTRNTGHIWHPFTTIVLGGSGNCTRSNPDCVPGCLRIVHKSGLD